MKTKLSNLHLIFLFSVIIISIGFFSISFFESFSLTENQYQLHQIDSFFLNVISSFSSIDFDFFNFNYNSLGTFSFHNTDFSTDPLISSEESFTDQVSTSEIDKAQLNKGQYQGTALNALGFTTHQQFQLDQLLSSERKLILFSDSQDWIEIE